MSFAVALTRRLSAHAVLRLVFLPIAATLLLAAGDAGHAERVTGGPGINDALLAPMPAAEAAAARAELAATTPADVRNAVLILPEDDSTTAGNARLSDLVANVGTDALAADADLACLATAVYFESRGEPLEGQLAVAQSILNRVESGRYASSVCGVIRQPGQYSFAKARTPNAGRDWQIARAIAVIAAEELWRDVAPGAMDFHATRVSPGWRGKTRIAQIGNHIFYR